MILRRWLVAGILLSASLVLTGGGRKSKTYLFTVHLEGSEDEAPKFASPAKLGSESRQYFFKKIPDFTDDHVAWFYPFVSEDGKSFGAAFKLKDHKSQALKALTLQHTGKLLGIRVPGAPYAAVLIDKPIDDGIIVLWEGLAKEHLKQFEKKFPHSDEAGPGSTLPVAPPNARAISLPPSGAR